MRQRINQRTWNHTPVWRLSERVLIRPYVSMTIPPGIVTSAREYGINLILKRQGNQSHLNKIPRANLHLEIKLLHSIRHPLARRRQVELPFIV